MSALLLLLRLNMRAMFRRIWRGAQTTRGALLTLFTVVFFSLMLLPSVIASFNQEQPELGNLIEFLPLMLLGYFVASLITSGGDRAIYFSPSEIDFLFSGPFSRRELLAYKILVFLVSSLVMAGIMSIAFISQLPNMAAAFIGCFLVFVFMTLSGMFITLIGQIVSAHAYTAVRKYLALAVIGMLLIAAAQSFTGMSDFEDVQAMLTKITSTTIGSVVLWPFTQYANIITFSDGFWLSLCLGISINVGLIIGVLCLDANYLETATQVSQKIFDKIQRAKAGGMTRASNRLARWQIRMFPFLRGTGPVIWRQMLTSLRKGGNLVFIAVLLGACFSLPVFLDTKTDFANSPKIVPIVLGGLGYITVILSMHLPLGFRGDIDHIEVLKALPLNNLPVAFGQIVSSSLVMTMFHLLVIVIMIAVCPNQFLWWTLGFAFSAPLNLLVFGLADTMFLLFPVRTQTGAKDLQAIGQSMLFMIIQMLLLTACLAVITIPAALLFMLTNSIAAAVVLSWLLLAMTSGSSIFLAAWAFGRHDVSQHRSA